MNIQPQEFARTIVENDWPPETCRNLFMLDIGPRPSTAEHRRSCFYEVAHRRKDPTVCEFLMPSEYGIACIKKTLPPVEGPEIGTDCEDHDGKMLCYSSYNALIAHNQDVVIDYSQCEKITDVNMQDWCYIGRVRTIPAEQDCSKVVLNQDHKDFCMYTLAMKIKDANLCEKIEHPIRRSACGLLLRKW